MSMDAKSDDRSISEILIREVQVYLLVACGVAIPLVATFVLTSDFTAVGPAFYSAVGSSDSEWWLAVGGGLMALGYVLDLHMWSNGWQMISFVYAAVTVACILVGFVFMSASAPSIPIILGFVTVIFSVVGIRRYMLKEISIQEFSFTTSCIFASFALGLSIVWLIWAATPALGGYHTWTMRKLDVKKNKLLTVFVMWCSPVILALACGIAALFTLLRGKFHASTPWHDGQSNKQDFHYVLGELKLTALSLGIMGLVAWVAAALAASDMGLSHTVMRLSATMGVLITIYIWNMLGTEMIEQAAKESDTVQMVWYFIHSDWVKGLFVLFFLPLLPVYLAAEFFHQCLRRLWQVFGIEQARLGDSGGWLTQEARENCEMWSNWEKASVLSKCMMFGVLYFILFVGVSQGVTVFLSWLTARITPWPLPVIIVALFAIGMFMFLLPPVPGLPIYAVSGLVIVNRCKQDGWSFFFGCTLATGFCFFLKLAAIVAQQKGIGEQFSDSVRVKKLVAIHTPQMKAVRHILNQEGWRLSKVAVLVGGPDWPTSVLTGILKLRVSEMLLGSTPIIFVVLPVVLAGAFTLQQQGTGEQATLYRNIANVMTMMASIMLVACTIIAGYYVESTIQENRQAIEEGSFERDPQEDEVLKEINKYERYTQHWKEQTNWSLLPCWLRLLLLKGSLMMSFMMHIILEPFGEPFKSFSVTQRISDLPGGTVLGLINPCGYVAILLFCASSMCLTIFEVWCYMHVKDNEKDEHSRLLPPA